MKRQLMVIGALVFAVLFAVSSSAAQDDKKMTQDGMDMAEMKKSPHHTIMMAYRHNVMTFAETLRDMAKGGKLEDVDLARNAFAEIKHSMEKMEDIRRSHMGKMTPEMREKMTPMMGKMQADKTAVKEHILALEKALQSAAPDAPEVEKHAAALVLQLEKMTMSDKKMDM